MRRLAGAFVFALLISWSSAGTADAGFEWCSEDPTFLVNGNLVDVTTSFPAAYKRQVSGPVVFELLVPENAIAAVVSLPGAVPLVGKVSDLRVERYSADPTVAASARAEFGKWHGYSLMLNMATLALVTAGMALAAQLPDGTSQSEIREVKEEKG